jgi:ribosomal protein S4
MARNTLYIKQKILNYIFTTFYNLKNKKIIKILNKKYVKIYSKFNNYLTIILKLLEQRLDIILFRSNLTIHLDLARILIKRGYVNINFLYKNNIAFQVQNFDIVSIHNEIRNTIDEISFERFESFRKIYLNRFYKIPYLNTISKYITTILNSLKQMISKNI